MANTNTTSLLFSEYSISLSSSSSSPHPSPRYSLRSSPCIAPPKYPYIFQRTYLCGHPDEFIHVSCSPDQEPGQGQGQGQLTHTLLQADHSLTTGAPFRSLRFSLQRCRCCAVEAQELHRGQSWVCERNVAAYQGSVIAGLETAGQRVKDGFQSALDALIGKRRKVHGRLGEDEEEEEDKEEALFSLPYRCQRYQPARRVKGVPSALIVGDGYQLARRVWDASLKALDGASVSLESLDASDASLESLDGSEGDRRTDMIPRTDGICDAPLTASTSSTDSLPSVSIPSQIFSLLPSSREPLVLESLGNAFYRTASRDSLPGIRGKGSVDCGTSSIRKTASLESNVDDCRNSVASENSPLCRTSSREEWEDDSYDIDDYYYGRYSMSPREFSESYNEHLMGPNEPTQTDQTLRIDKVLRDPHKVDRGSHDKYLMIPKKMASVDQIRRVGRIMEGPYDIDHGEQLMSPRESTQTRQTCPNDRDPRESYETEHSFDGEILISLQEALRAEKPHHVDRVLEEPLKANYGSDAENLMSLQEALRADQPYHFGTALKELEKAAHQPHEPKTNPLVPRGYLLYLKEALSRIAHDGLGDKAHRLSRIHTLQLNLCSFNNSDRESQRSDSPEFVCRSSSAIAASMRARSARTPGATDSMMSQTTRSSQSAFNAGNVSTSDRRSAETGQRSASSLNSSRPGSHLSSRPGSRLSSRPGSRPISSDTASTGDAVRATCAPQYARWRGRGTRNTRLSAGHAVSPALSTTRSATSPLDINKRLPALPKVTRASENM